MSNNRDGNKSNKAHDNCLRGLTLNAYVPAQDPLDPRINPFLLNCVELTRMRQRDSPFPFLTKPPSLIPDQELVRVVYYNSLATPTR